MLSVYKVFFGHKNSIGVTVEASKEKEARVKAMDILRLNRQQRSWSGSQCVYWEEGKTTHTPPVTKDFGEFPKIVKVELLD